MDVQKWSFIQTHEIVRNNNFLQSSAAGSSGLWAPSSHQGTVFPPHWGLNWPLSSLVFKWPYLYLSLKCFLLLERDGSSIHGATVCINPKMSKALISKAGVLAELCKWLGCFQPGGRCRDYFKLFTQADEIHEGLLSLHRYHSLGHFFLNENRLVKPKILMKKSVLMSFINLYY